MEPENGGLEDDVPLKNWVIFRFHVNFQWCNCVFYMHPFRTRRRVPFLKTFSLQIIPKANRPTLWFGNLSKKLICTGNKNLEMKISPPRGFRVHHVVHQAASLCLVWYVGVSENNGTPQIIHFDRVFHYIPSILGYHNFWKHPCVFQKPGCSILEAVWISFVQPLRLPLVHDREPWSKPRLENSMTSHHQSKAPTTRGWPLNHWPPEKIITSTNLSPCNFHFTQYGDHPLFILTHCREGTAERRSSMAQSFCAALAWSFMSCSMA